MKKKVYIAGPLFNDHERDFLEAIALCLEEEGFKCFLPHRDLTGVEESELKTTSMTQETKDKIFVADLNAKRVGFNGCVNNGLGHRLRDFCRNRVYVCTGKTDYWY